MKESTRMVLHYITGLGIVIAGGAHLFTIFFTGPYVQNLAFSGGAYSVIAVYRNLLLAGTLELLLIFVDYHALNGIRVIATFAWTSSSYALPQQILVRA